MNFKIKKIVQRRKFADYLIEGTHPKIGYVCKVVSVGGLNEDAAIKHLRARFEVEGTEEKVERGFSDSGNFPGNNDYWGWGNSLSQWLSPNDIIAKRQVSF